MGAEVKSDLVIGLVQSPELCRDIDVAGPST